MTPCGGVRHGARGKAGERGQHVRGVVVEGVVEVGGVEVLLAGRLRRGPRVVRVLEEAVEQRRDDGAGGGEPPVLVEGRAGEVARGGVEERVAGADVEARSGPLARAGRRRSSGSRSRPGSTRRGRRGGRRAGARRAARPAARPGRRRRRRGRGSPRRPAGRCARRSRPAGRPAACPPRARPSTQWKSVWPCEAIRSAPPKRSTASRGELREGLADPRVQPADGLERGRAPAAARPPAPRAGRRRTAR